MKGNILTSKALAKKIAAFALLKKAQNVVLLDLRKLTTMSDFFVICSADSDTHVRAIADAIRDGAQGAGEKVWHDEGQGQSTWVLLDFVDVVVHVFHKETRSFYNLEKLWAMQSLNTSRTSPLSFRQEEKPSGEKNSHQ